MKKEFCNVEMAINIKNVEADKLARELSEITGETITEAVIKSLAERLEREKNKKITPLPLQQELLNIAERYQALPTLDNRTEEEILGYNDGY
jgi:antitoxin VapB